jgi:caffeoyl-CoA O-methyltransferase
MTDPRPTASPLRSPEIRAAMARIEALDAADRLDGTPRLERLRCVSPEVGRFLHTLVLATAARTIVECGTSAGYSTLWLASAARATGGRVVTFEVLPEKVAMARETFAEAGVDDVVELRHEDAAAGLAGFDGAASDRAAGGAVSAVGSASDTAAVVETGPAADVVFIDVEKEMYASLLEPAVRALRPGGLLVADNLLSHEADLAGFRDAALSHPLLTGLVVPIGRGELVAVKRGPAVL